MIIVISNKTDSFLWRFGLWRRFRMRMVRDPQFWEHAKGFAALAFCVAAMWAVVEAVQR